MKDIKADRELLSNPRLDAKSLKEKFFFSKIPSAQKSPHRNPKPQPLYSVDDVPQLVSENHLYTDLGLNYNQSFRPSCQKSTKKYFDTAVNDPAVDILRYVRKDRQEYLHH